MKALRKSYSNENTVAHRDKLKVIELNGEVRNGATRSGDLVCVRLLSQQISGVEDDH